MTDHGDENGLVWTTSPRLGQSSRRGKKRPPPKPQRPDWEAPTEFPSFRDLPRIGLDCETHDPDLKAKGPGVRRDGYICGVAIATDRLNGDYYPVGHDEGPNLDPAKVFGWLREEAKDFKGEIVGANLQYDFDYLAEQGVHFPHAKIRDVQIAEPLIDENQFEYTLERISNKWLGEGKDTNELLELYGPDYIRHMRSIFPGHAAKRAISDVLLPFEIIDAQTTVLEQQSLGSLFEIESKLPHLLLKMRRQGVRVDVDKAVEAREALSAERDTLLDQLSRPTDVWAPDSVARLFDAEGIKYPYTEKTGRPSFKKEWLQAHRHPTVKQILEIRSLDRLIGTFLTGYILESHINGRIHCNFNQLRGVDGGARSGRFSSSHPNLQNIPKRDEKFGPLMRSIFLPEDGLLWGCADWSQIEYRFLVHYGVLAKLRSALKAAEMYRNDPKTDFHELASDITKQPRKVAKNINFGVVYGMGPPLMAEILGLPLAEGAAVLAEFHAEMPFLKRIYDIAQNRAKAKGFIKTILGRRRRFPDGEFCYRALNALLQGSAADLMKKAMVDIWEAGIFDILIPHLTVHDELDVSIPDTRVGYEAFQELIHMMETALTLEIPILASADTGLNWNEANG